MFVLNLLRGADQAPGARLEVQPATGQTRFLIGRDPACHWPLNDRTLALSGRHCEIEIRERAAWLRDLSTNGTFINDELTRLQGDYRLTDGDRFAIGPFIVGVRLLPETTANVAAKLSAAGGGGVAAGARGGDPAASWMSASGPASPAGQAHAAAAGMAPVQASSASSASSSAPQDRPAAEDAPLTRIAPASKASAPAPTPPARVADTIVTPGPLVAPWAAPAASRQAAAPAEAAVTAAASAPTSAPAAAMAAPPAAAAAGPAAQANTSPSRHPLPLHRLAVGLGLPPGSLDGRDAGDLLERVGAALRVAIESQRQAAEQQAAQKRRLGSRSQAALRADAAHPLRVASSAQDAMLALLRTPAGPAWLQHALGDTLAHHEHLFSATQSAFEKLGADLAPEALEHAIDKEHSADGATLMAGARKAALWDLYTQLWRTSGLAAGTPWAQNFVAAALLHLAAAYDAAEHAPQPPR